MSTETNTDERWLRDREAAARLGVSRSTLWDLVRRGDYPAPTKFSAKITRFRLSEIERWEGAKIAAE